MKEGETKMILNLINYSTDSISVTIEDQNVQKTTFEPTEKMSTYLLAFIVSDFAYINNTIDGVLVSDLPKRFCH